MRIILWIFCLCILIAQDPFNWQDDGAPIRQGAHIEWWKSVESGNEGEFFILWSDTRLGIRDIFAQKVNIDGNMLWGNDGEPISLQDGLPDGIPVVQAPGRQEDQIIVSDGSGGFYMIWMDYRDEPDQGDIYGQHVYNDGSLQYELGGIPLSNQPGKQSSPNLCIDNTGGAFAIWKDGSDIRGTHLSFDGEVLAQGIGILLNNSPFNRGGISLEVVADGKAAMTWSREIATDANENANSDIVVQVIDSQCNTLWAEPNEGGVIICDAPNIQTSPKVTYMDGTNFVVVWQDHRVDPLNSDAYIQFLDINGNEVFETGGLNLSPVDGNQNKPRVKADESGAYVIWQDYRFNSENPDLYIQKVSVYGPILEENGKALTALETSYRGQARLTVDGMGGAYFIWEDYRNGEFPEVDIYAQHLNNNNTFSFIENGLEITTAPFKQQGPVVRKDGLGGVFAGWDDYRDGSNSIFIQHINPEIGTTLEDNGRVLFKGITGNVGDGETDIRAESILLDDGNALVYWLDLRKSPFQSLTYGKIIGTDYNQIDWTNGSPLCLNDRQALPSVANSNGTFMLAFSHEGEYSSIYYQMLDNDLNMIGDQNGTLLYQADGWNMLDPKLTADNEGNFYMAYIDDRNMLFGFLPMKAVYLQKFDISGNPQWPDGGILVSSAEQEAYLKAIHLSPSGEIIIVWEEQYLTYEIRVQSIMTNGNISEGWPANGAILVNNNGTQGWISQNTNTILTDTGILTVWEDTRNGNNDLFGQIISYSGEILGSENGINIVTANNDQLDPAIDYNNQLNHVNICWTDYRNGEGSDLYCNTFNIDEMSMQSELLISDNSGSQGASDVVSGPGHRYIVVWDDERNGSGAISDAPQKDVYLQEIYFDDQIVYPDNGYPLCDMEFAQRNPSIIRFGSNTDNYLTFWEDLRSTGKEELVNLYGQSINFEPLNIDINELSPHSFKIQNIYPNPFNPITTISYSLINKTFIEFDVINIKGKRVSKIFSGYSEAGLNSFDWKVESLSSGMYFIRMQANGQIVDKQKAFLVK